MRRGTLVLVVLLCFIGWMKVHETLLGRLGPIRYEQILGALLGVPSSQQAMIMMLQLTNKAHQIKSIKFSETWQNNIQTGKYLKFLKK